MVKKTKRRKKLSKLTDEEQRIVQDAATAEREEETIVERTLKGLGVDNGPDGRGDDPPPELLVKVKWRPETLDFDLHVAGDVGGDGTGDGAGDGAGRDVFFIQTRLNDDDVMVYRNEDTGWGWPPYFKFDTANLQAEAADLRSTAAAPQLVVIRHYGWRNEFLSVYPNVVSLRPVDGPDVRIIPWLNIILLTLLVAVVWALYVRWRRFRQARIDPVLDDMGDNLDEAGGRLKGFFRRKG